MEYKLTFYRTKLNYVILSNNPANNCPYSSAYGTITAKNNILVSDKVIKFAYNPNEIGYFNTSKCVGVKLTNDENDNVLYYDIERIDIEKNLLIINVKRYIFSDVGVYEQLCYADNSYIDFERSNYFPANLSGTSYLRAKQDLLTNINYNSMEINSIDIGSGFTYVCQFCVRNADSTFTDQTYNNYIRTYFFNNPYFAVYGKYGTITQDISVIQKINSFYGKKSNELTNPQKVELLNVYIVPSDYISDFIYGSEYSSDYEFSFKTVDSNKLYGYTLISNIITLEKEEKQRGLKIKNFTITKTSKDVENNANYKYFIGTFGKLTDFTKEYTYSEDIEIQLKIAISNEMFSICLVINGDEIEFSDELSASTTSNSAEALETQKLGRILGFVGTTFSTIGKIASGNIASGFTGSQTLLNYNNPLYGGSVNPKGNYALTYCEYIKDNININDYYYCPFKIIKFKTASTNEDIDNYGLNITGTGLLFGDTTTKINDMKFIQNDNPLYVKGDLIIKKQVVNSEILQVVQSTVKNGLYFKVI